jgi:hypothetical protein
VTSSAISGSQEALSITLPAHWQRIHTEQLLDDALADLADPTIVEVFGHAEAEGAQRALARVRDLCHAENVVLVAIRMRPDAQAIDQLSLALPGMERITNSGSIRNATNSKRRRPEITDDVDIDGLQTVSHRSIPAESPDESAVRGSQVQLVFVVPGSDRGAVLTLLSSAVGVDDLLELEAEEIVGSIRMTRADEAEAHAAFSLPRL